MAHHSVPFRRHVSNVFMFSRSRLKRTTSDRLLKLRVLRSRGKNNITLDVTFFVLHSHGRQKSLFEGEEERIIP
jgi:hypothetical protein